MAQFYDPQRALTEDWRTFCLEHRDERFIIPCIEGEVELNGRWLLLNLMICMPLIKRHRSISRDKHMMLSGIFGASAHSARLTAISETLESLGYTREELGHDMIMSMNDALNMCYTHLGSFVRTMDIFTMADTILQPGFKEICQPNYGDITDKNIHRMEEAFKAKSKEVIDILSGDTLPYNTFRAPLLCGALKVGQFAQFVVSAGPRSDTDDQMFLRPVFGSFLSGMRDILDLAFESRSASKATHMNKSQMANVQYVNRKFHIQASAIDKLYPGDCGSAVYMTYEPCRRTVKNFKGKFFYDANNNLIELTEDLYPTVVGKAIKVRDVITCRHTDGFCEVCGGTITKSFSRNGNVGFLSNVNTGAPVAQQVLSTKHLISTDSAKYEIPDELEDIFMSSTNDIFLRPSMRKRKDTLALGFRHRDVSKINDLQYYVSENELHAAYFTDIKYLTLGQLKEDGSVEKYGTQTSMGGDNKTYPHLSPEVLAVIRNHPEDIVTQDGISWLLLRNANTDLPIMQCVVVNNSIKRFVDKFRDLVTNKVEKYTSANVFMRDFTKLVWPKVDTHITHMSCLARASMITSKADFHIPEVTDPDNVMFGTLGKIIPMRYIGALAAFQGFNTATNKPTTFITAKRTGIFDRYMGYTDDIEANMNWPVESGSPLQTLPL